MYPMKFIYHKPKTIQTTMYTSTTLEGKKTTFEHHKRNRFECNNDREMQLTMCGGSWTSHSLVEKYQEAARNYGTLVVGPIQYNQ